LEEYAINEIKTECEIGKERNFTKELLLKNKTIKQYAANSLKLDVINNKNHQQRYDWDSFTYKDREGDLLNYIAEYHLANDDVSKSISATKILKKIEENLIKYYEREFEDKVEDHKNFYQHYGNFDYIEA
jgi:hypothetical protein